MQTPHAREKQKRKINGRQPCSDRSRTHGAHTPSSRPQCTCGRVNRRRQTAAVTAPIPPFAAVGVGPSTSVPRGRRLGSNSGHATRIVHPLPRRSALTSNRADGELRRRSATRRPGPTHPNAPNAAVLVRIPVHATLPVAPNRRRYCHPSRPSCRDDWDVHGGNPRPDTARTR